MPIHVHARRLIGQPVRVRTHDGRFHHGVLHSVTNEGIYVRPGAGNVSAMKPIDIQAQTADLESNKVKLQDEFDQVWSPFWFFPWWALGGLWWW